MGTFQISTWLFLLPVFLFFYTFILPYFTSPLRRIPGPFLAKFTNLWRLFNTYDGRAELRHRQLHEQYGPVVRLGPSVVSLSDPKLIKKIYNTRGDFLKSNFYAVNDVKAGKQTISTIFGTRSNSFHTSQNRLVHRYYTMPSLKVFEPHVNATIDHLQTRLEQEFIQGNASRVCKLEDCVNFFAWDVIGRITFSKPFGFLDEWKDVNGIIDTAERGLDYFAVIGQMPWLDQLLDKNPIKRFGPPSFNVATALCVDHTLKRLNAYEHERDATKQKDFLDYCIQIKEENPGVIGIPQLVGILLVNIIAGADTTIASICAILYYVLKNEKVYRKLRSELDSSRLSLPVFYDKAVELPYLTAVVRESMRMHPGVGLPLERIVPDIGLTTPDGTVLPPGTIVGMSAWVVHMDKTVFGQDAASFNPERWLKSDLEREEDFKSRLAAMNAADLVFGAGKRSCIGKNVSLLEIYKLIPSLFLKYDIAFVDPTKDWKIQNSWFVRQKGMEVEIKLR